METTVLIQSIPKHTGMLHIKFDQDWLTDTEAPFLDLHLSISNGFVSSKIYDKRDDFDFDIVNFPFLDGDVPRSTSYGAYIPQLIRFLKVSSHVADFNARNLPNFFNRAIGVVNFERLSPNLSPTL